MKSKKLLLIAPAIISAIVFTGCKGKTVVDTNKVSEAQWGSAIVNLFEPTVEKNYHVTKNKDNSDKVDTLDVKGNLLYCVEYGDTNTYKTKEIKNEFGYFTNNITLDSEGKEVSNGTNYPEIGFAGISMNRSHVYAFMGDVLYCFGEYNNFKYDETSKTYKRNDIVSYSPYLNTIQFNDGKLKYVEMKGKEGDKETTTVYTIEYGDAKVESVELEHKVVHYDTTWNLYKTDFFEFDKNKTHYFSFNFPKYFVEPFNKLVFSFIYEDGTREKKVIVSTETTKYSPCGWFNTMYVDGYKQIGFKFNAIDGEDYTFIVNDGLGGFYTKPITFACWANPGSPHTLKGKVALVIEPSMVTE